MKRVLLTGARGFVGRHCLAELSRRGFEVHAVSRCANVASRDPGVIWHQANLLDSRTTYDLVARVQPTELMHLAWITICGEYWESPENLSWVRAGLDLIEAFAQHGGRRAVMVGTCAEYDWQSGECHEATTPLLPKTLYGTAKHALRMLAESRFQQCGISLAWPRLFLLYGPQESPRRLVPSVIESLLADEVARCTAGDQVRDFVHVQDAADALVAVLDSEICGPINVASGSAIHVRELVHEVARQIGNPELLRLGALPAPANDPPTLVADVRRLQSELGWAPKYNINTGLAQTIQWHRTRRTHERNPGFRSRPNCPVCQSSSTELFLERANVVAHQNQITGSRREAKTMPRGDLRLTCCRKCGFVFNSAFELSRLSYDAGYDNCQTWSPRFTAHVDHLVRYLIDEREVRNCRIVEVGCGQGDFLRRLIEFPSTRNTGVGFDPSYAGPLGGEHDPVRFERKYYDAASALIPADVVICRHVIEHVLDPVALLTTVRQALVQSPRARLFFETPCVEWILANQVVWDFFYEHCSYFSRASLSTAFQHAGFQVADVQHVFGGQYLWLEARLDGEPAPHAVTAGKIPDLAANFGAFESRLVADWRKSVQHHAQQGRVALWGAGAKGVTCANLIDPAAQLLDCIVDINRHKQGAFLPGTGHPIVGPEALSGRGVTTALVLNPNYFDEIAKLLEANKIRVTPIDLMDQRREAA